MKQQQAIWDYSIDLLALEVLSIAGRSEETSGCLAVEGCLGLTPGGSDMSTGTPHICSRYGIMTQLTVKGIAEALPVMQHSTLHQARPAMHVGN